MRFAVTDEAGRLPSLEDLDPLVSEKDLKTIDGLFKVCIIDGPFELNRKLFLPLKGSDQKFAEFKRKQESGIRIMSFMEDNRVLLLLTAFQKPPQLETPPEEKARMREVLQLHYLNQKSRGRRRS